MLCAIYCRLSREDDNRLQESESIRNQKKLLLDYAIRQSWDIYAIYSDEDYSGADRDRPEWNRMLRDAEAGKFAVVLCKNQSRFTRDLEVVEQYIHGRFVQWGIRFVALLDSADTDVQGNKKARQINGLINEWYLEDLSENVRAVLDRKRRDGCFIGSFPAYGYRRDPEDHNHLLVDEEVADTVRTIFSRYLNGMGTHAIAERLNAEEIAPPSLYRKRSENGGQGTERSLWSGTTVSRILRNEVYLGNLIQGKRRKASYKSGKLLTVPEEQWVRVENTHEAIVDRETFDAVRQRIAARTRSDGTGNKHVLAGKVRCADCKSAMIRLSHNYRGTSKSYLQCGLYAKNRKAAQCSGHTVRLDRLTKAVEERIRVSREIYYPDLDPVLRNREADSVTEREQRQKARNENRLGRLETALRSLYIDKASGLLTAEEYLDLKRSLEAERDALAGRIAALETEERDIGDSGTGGGREISLMHPALIDLLIDRIEIGEKDPEDGSQAVTIHWKI